ncbi:MAG: hypothetical protein QOI45_510 [Thermoleophilaceae bacterium]|nr:hypothetical protein [Thermoleophilaceae bacterium]
MHLRRALLLFAIVLGLAAIAASVSRPRNAADPLRAPPAATETEPTPTVSPAPEGSPPVELTFGAGERHAQRVFAGQAVTVLVKVEQAGQVEIADLGMSAVAEPLTPGRFEVLTRAVGRHPITFTEAGGTGQAQRVATLVVTQE